MAEPSGTFAGLLRELRRRARLTQEELADAAGVSLRTVSDLERGVATTPQKETVRLLADALHLIGPERVQFETAARGRPLASGSPAAAAAMRSLPRDVASFTGRQRELAQLAKSAMTAGGVVDIHAIGGMAGVGKTAFAVHAAHQLADRFPGGQIFLLLHGHTPGQQPVDPADALASLLLTIGIPAAQVPLGLEARAALWRDRVAGRQLLLVLDDAASSEQVRPLVPGAGGSLVLVTSRRHLSALDDATAISLDTLPPGEAAALLVRLAGRAALSSDDPAVLEVARLCGFLPLAIGMLARQLRHHPAWTVAGRAAELASARDRLELLETEHLSVAAAFDLSYATLTPDRQRLFRRLGLHPGADMDGYAAAALDGTSLSAARGGLEALYDQYLLTEPAQGRYRLHDLIREHARVLAGRVDPDEGREAATARLLDYYQHAAAVANARITGRARPEQAADGAVPTAVPALHDQEQAMAWARAERASLLACLDHAVGTGQHGRVTALTAGLSGLLQHDGPWADAVGRHTVAAQAAQYLGDHLSQANALNDLGEVQRLMGDYPAAVRASEEALGVYRDLGDRLGQARTLSCLGEIWMRTADYPAAVRVLEEALGIYRDLGDRLGQARALICLGEVRRVTGDFQAAVRVQEEALGIYREVGDRLGQARTLSWLGNVRRVTGDYPAAVRASEEALGVYRDLGNRLGQATAMNSLGRMLRVTGDYPAAVRASEEALAIYRDIGDRGGEAEALNDRGALHRASGEPALAEGYHRQSLELSHAIASSWDEAHALAGLGRCALDAGHTAQAEDLLRQALEIFQRIGAAEAQELRAELDDLANPPPHGG
jgi:tetratricopeptide (TPR) repeat protein/transcriptional regulator with XRE-family HTH domain